MAIAEIITIGTELLLGEIHDTNSRYIARVLRDIGVDLYRLTAVGDNKRRITATMQEALMRADVENALKRAAKPRKKDSAGR